MTHDEDAHEFRPRTSVLDRASLTWLEWMLVFAMFIVLAVLGVLWVHVQNLQGIQTRMKVELLENRQSICRLLVGVGVQLTGDGPCAEIARSGMFDPSEVQRAVTEEELLRVVCAVHDKLGGEYPSECER